MNGQGLLQEGSLFLWESIEISLCQFPAPSALVRTMVLTE